LIKRKIIEDKNAEIRSRGEAKFKSMKAIKNIKFEVCKAEHDAKINELKLKLMELKNKEI